MASHLRSRLPIVVAALGAAAGVALFLGRRPAPPADDDGIALPDGAAGVTVYDDGIPFADRWVVFHDASGRVVSSVRSDASGKASAAVPEGGMISVAYGESVHHLVTVVGVRPGEGIVVGEREDEGEGEGGRAVASARVRLPGRRPGAARYSVALGIAETEVAAPETPLTVSVLERFVTAPTDGDAAAPGGRFRVLGEALAPSGDPLAFTFGWGHVADGGAVDVALPAWSDAYRSVDVRLANRPAGVRRVRGRLAVLGPHDLRFVRPPREAGEAEGAIRFAVPPALGDEAIVRLEAAWDDGDRSVLAVRGRVEDARTIDLGAELLPRVSEPAAERGAEAARPIVKWKTAPGPANVDATVVRMTWPATAEHVWTIVLPPTARGPLTLPELPDVLAAWRPDGRPAKVAVALVESSEYASYDDVRAKGIDVAAEGLEEDDDGSLRWSATGDIAF